MGTNPISVALCVGNQAALLHRGRLVQSVDDLFDVSGSKKLNKHVIRRSDLTLQHSWFLCDCMLSSSHYRVWSGNSGKNISHFSHVIMGAMAPQITSLKIVYSTVYLGSDQRKHQSSASPAFMRGNHRRPMNSTHKWPVTWKMFTFDDVIMVSWLMMPSPKEPHALAWDPTNSHKKYLGSSAPSCKSTKT